MIKKSISSLELAALVQELQFLVGAKIDQIYHQDAKELLFQLRVAGKGKVLLKVLPGKWVCLTTRKETPLSPSGFCMQLRKYLDHATITSLYQQDAERILIIELEKQEKYKMIVELFSKGNLVLVDKDWNSLAVLETQTWKDRVVKPKEIYLFPKPSINWKMITEKELEKLLQKSEKKSIVISLATDLGLGGLYAEEISKREGLDKEKKPQEISSTEVKKIVQSIKELLKLAQRPQGYMYDENVTPFPLLNQKPKQETKTYNEALDFLNPFELVSPFEKRIASLHHTIEEQQGSMKKQQEMVELNTKKAELIYEYYQPLQKMWEIVKELRKTKSWNVIAVELQKEKRIKMVNLKTKKIVIDL